jgi:hypothetical protein
MVVDLLRAEFLTLIDGALEKNAGNNIWKRERRNGGMLEITA